MVTFACNENGGSLMEYQVKFHPAALKEFCELDGSIKRKREDMEVYATAAERIPKFQKGKS